MGKTGKAVKPMGRTQALEVTASLALAALVLWGIFHARPLAYLAAALLATGLFLPRAAAAIARGWMAFGAAVGAVNAKILLSLVWFLLLTPIAFIYRKVHGDTLRLGKRGGGPSLWIARDHRCEAGDLEKGW